MRHLKESIKLFRYKPAKLLLFELLLHFAGLSVLFPLYYFVVNSTIRLAGIEFLSRENIGTYLKHPTTYILILLYLIFIALFMIFHVTAVISYLHAARMRSETGVMKMLRTGAAGLLRTLRPKNLFYIPMVFFFLPVSFSGVIVMKLLNLKLPSYVQDVLHYKGSLGFIMTMVFLLVNLIFFRHMNLFHIYTLEKKTFLKAFRESGSKPKKCRFFGWNLFWIAFFLIGTLALHYLFVGIVMEKVFKVRGMITLYRIIRSSVTILLSLIFWLFAMPLMLSGITVSHEGYAEESKEDAAEREAEVRRAGKRERLFLLVIFLVSLILNGGFFLLRHLHVFSLNAEYLDTVTITAHRGDSKVCPENTLAAFRSAVESGADVIELDVRQTKDGVVIVSHDENIRRVSGVNRKIGKMTYAELMEASAGKYFGKGYENEPFPTLEEAIREIDGRTELNIELKPASTDTDMIEQVVRLVEDYDLVDSCVVTSQNYKAIRTVKELNEKIKTVYVMSVALGDFYTLKYADAFSIKYTYIDSDVVKKAHKHGKEIYAWTVDSKAGLKKMMMLHVDSIITNKPFEMKQMMLDIYYSDTLYESIGDLLGQ